VASACCVAVVAGIFLLSPRPVPSDTPGALLEYFPLCRFAGFIINWDSPHYLVLAAHPGGLLAAGEARQSRPLYPLAGAAIRACIAPLFPSRPRSPVGDPGYTAYVLLNALALVLAMCAFQALFPNTGSSPIPFLVSTLLLANHVVKVFFWSPNPSVMSVLVPLLAMLWYRHLQRRPQMPPPRAFARALGAGTLTLFYGSFLVFLPIAIVAVVVAGRRDADARAGLGTRLGAVTAGFLVAPVGWIAFVTLVAGRFYSDEIGRFRQFVWIVDGVRFGYARLIMYLAASQFLRWSADVLWFPLALALAAIVLARRAGVRTADVERAHGESLRAAAIALAALVAFFVLMGTYGYRMEWNFVPPILVLIAAILATVEERIDARRRPLLTGVVATVVAGWLVHEVTKRGPWL
jgi:hypothetical protein